MSGIDPSLFNNPMFGGAGGTTGPGSGQMTPQQAMYFWALMNRGGGSQGGATASPMGAMGNAMSPIMNAIMMRRMMGAGGGSGAPALQGLAGQAQAGAPAVGTEQMSPWWQGYMQTASGQGPQTYAPAMNTGAGPSGGISGALSGVGNWLSNLMG